MVGSDNWSHAGRRLAVLVAILMAPLAIHAATVDECLQMTGYAFSGHEASGVNMPNIAADVDLYGPTGVVSCVPVHADVSTNSVGSGSGLVVAKGGIGSMIGTGALALADGNGTWRDAYARFTQYYLFTVSNPVNGILPITIHSQLEFGPVVLDISGNGAAGNTFVVGIQVYRVLTGGLAGSFGTPQYTPYSGLVLPFSGGVSVYANAEYMLTITTSAESVARSGPASQIHTVGSAGASQTALHTFFLEVPDGAEVQYPYQGAFDWPPPQIGVFSTVPLPAGFWLLLAGVLPLVLRHAPRLSRVPRLCGPAVIQGSGGNASAEPSRLAR